MLLTPEHSHVQPTSFGGAAASSNVQFETSRFDSAQVFEQIIPYASRQIPIRGGSASLHLIKPLSLKVVADPLSVTVLDWDIQVTPQRDSFTPDLSELIESIEQRVGRTFLQLASKAVKGSLTERDENIWLRISDYVDYNRYCETNAVPLYLEGTVVWKNGKLKVRLDTDTVCDPKDSYIAAQFADFRSGERFGGYLQINSKDEIVSAHGLEFVYPLPADKVKAFEEWRQGLNKK